MLRDSDFLACLHEGHDMARRAVRDLVEDRCGMVGYGVVQLLDGDGRPTLLVPFGNLITDTGDAYYAAMGIALVSPANAAQPTKLTGMQIGSNSGSAPAKNGAGSALGTLLAGQAFDATYPQVSNLGAGLGVNAVYKTTYAAGTGTGSVVEASLTNTATLGTAGNAAATIARSTFSAINKGASDSLALTWNNKFLGA